MAGTLCYIHGSGVCSGDTVPHMEPVHTQIKARPGSPKQLQVCAVCGGRRCGTCHIRVSCRNQGQAYHGAQGAYGYCDNDSAAGNIHQVDNDHKAGSGFPSLRSEPIHCGVQRHQRGPHPYHSHRDLHSACRMGSDNLHTEYRHAERLYCPKPDRSVLRSGHTGRRRFRK